MNSVSLMHCADMHIGKIISAFDKNKNNIRMCESEQACLSVIDNASDCDIVLLSGDIFDSPDVSESLCKTFVDKIKSMHNVNFFYSCGNHDPYISKITDYIVPLLLLGCCLWALRKKENTYDLLLQGGQEGLKLVINLIPTLVILLTAVTMLRASGAMEWISSILAPVFLTSGVPKKQSKPLSRCALPARKL